MFREGTGMTNTVAWLDFLTDSICSVNHNLSPHIMYEASFLDRDFPGLK